MATVLRALPLFALAALALPPAAHACRCAPEALERYFARADVVVLARALAVAEDRPPDGDLRVTLAPLDSPFKGAVDADAHFTTPRNSAGCGVPIVPGRVYLIFASRLPTEPQRLHVDTCNGTRSFDAESPDGALGFIDTPADKVLLRLQGLRVAAAVQDPRANPGGPRLPKFGDPDAQIIGLLELPSIFGEEQAAPGTASPRAAGTALALRIAPNADAAVVARIAAAGDLLTREYTYERPAAVVRARRDGWYRLALDDSRGGWLAAADAGRFHAVAELLPSRLNYLTEHWDGWLWPVPGAGLPVQVVPGERPRESAVNLVATQMVADTLWLRVELLAHDPCSGDPPVVRQSGWVPAYTPDGLLTAWFYARGC